MLETVIQYGTGKAAAIGQFAAGKTGTTSNYGDAWFVGWDSKFTVAVWVGYPNKLIPMTTDFNGGPVLGGTFPALIWHDFMISALQIEKERAEHSWIAEDGQQAAPVVRQPKPARRSRRAPPARSLAPAPARTRPRTARPTRTSAQNGAGNQREEAPARRPPNTPPRPPRPATATAHEAPSTPAPATPGARRATGDAARPRGGGERRARRSGCRAGVAARRGGCPPRRSASAARPPWLIPTRVPSTTSGSSQPFVRGPMRTGPLAARCCRSPPARCRAPA